MHGERCCRNFGGREGFLLMARLAVGIWLGYIGLGKWIGGPSDFVGHIGTQFAETWVPPMLSTMLGWLIVIAEPVVALWLLSGVAQACAWRSATALFFLLMFGQTILKNGPVIASNWFYLAFAMVCAALAGIEKSGVCHGAAEGEAQHKACCG